MNQIFFSIRLRRYTTLWFLSVIVFFAFLTGTAAKDRCPSSDDHETSAIRYKMFTAYQIAFDGYQAPCELKCFDKEECTQSCRTEKALDSLSKHFKKELKQRNTSQCKSIENICMQECSGPKNKCESACRS